MAKVFKADIINELLQENEKKQQQLQGVQDKLAQAKADYAKAEQDLNQGVLARATDEQLIALQSALTEKDTLLQVAQKQLAVTQEAMPSITVYSTSEIAERFQAFALQYGQEQVQPAVDKLQEAKDNYLNALDSLVSTLNDLEDEKHAVDIELNKRRLPGEPNTFSGGIGFNPFPPNALVSDSDVRKTAELVRVSLF